MKHFVRIALLITLIALAAGCSSSSCQVRVPENGYAAASIEKENQNAALVAAAKENAANTARSECVQNDLDTLSGTMSREYDMSFRSYAYEDENERLVIVQIAEFPLWKTTMEIQDDITDKIRDLRAYADNYGYSQVTLLYCNQGEKVSTRYIITCGALDPESDEEGFTFRDEKDTCYVVAPL